MFQNIVIGRPLVEPWNLLAFNKNDWEQSEKANTLFTNERWLPTIMKEAGLVKSNNEVRKNRPDLCISLDEVGFVDLKWGKRFLFIVIGE